MKLEADMKTIVKTMLLAGWSVLFAWPVQAEFRQWTDTKGKTIQAEFVSLDLDTVVLRRKDGSTFKIPLDALSGKDRKYVQLKVPPNVNIRVAANVERKIAGYTGNYENSYRIQYQVINPEVTVRKTSATPYEAPLFLSLVIIGRVQETGRYVVLDNESSSFTFTPENRNKYTFQGVSMDLQQIKGSLRMGVEYNGYVAVVRDSKGEILQTKASRSLLAEHAGTLMKARSGTFLNKKMKPVKVRNPARNLNESSLPGRMY